VSPSGVALCALSLGLAACGATTYELVSSWFCALRGCCACAACARGWRVVLPGPQPYAPLTEDPKMGQLSPPPPQAAVGGSYGAVAPGATPGGFQQGTPQQQGHGQPGQYPPQGYAAPPQYGAPPPHYGGPPPPYGQHYQGGPPPGYYPPQPPPMMTMSAPRTFGNT
jgi:hypothetical protein